MEEQYKSFVEFTDNLITQVNKEGLFTFVNKSSEKYFGISPEECIGRSVFDFIDPRDKVRTIEWFDTCLANHRTSDKIENRQIGIDEVVHEMRWNVHFQYDQNGELASLNSIGTDITEDKRRDRIEAASWRFIAYAKDHTVMELLQKFLDEAESLTNSDIGFFHFVEEDQQTISLQTWSTNTLENMCTAEGAGTHYPFSKAGVWVDCVKEKKPVIHNDYINLKHKKGLPEGHAPIVREMVVPVFRDDNIVAILGVGNKKALYTDQDVLTVQQLADKAWETIVRKRAEEEVDKLRIYLDDVINSMPSLLVGVDENCCITHWNREAQNQTGFKLTEVKGRPLENIIPRLAGICQSIKEKAVTGQEKKETLDYTMENGELRRDIVTLFPLSSASAKGAVIRIDDITERMQLEVLLMNSEKMLSLGRLSAGIAHEINNPLAGIVNAVCNISNRLGYNEKHPLEMREDDDITEDQLHRFLDKRRIPKMMEYIKEGSHRIADITNDMTNFEDSRSDVLSSCIIEHIIEKSLRILEIETRLLSTLDFGDISITRDFNGYDQPVICEGSKIEQVFVNVLRNAVQAMAEVKSAINELTIRTGRDSAGGYFNIEISDNGPGINEEVRKRMFEPFYTTRDVGQGIGLGLSISYFIVTNLHKGKMSVYSEEGAGTKVLIQLPLPEQG